MDKKTKIIISIISVIVAAAVAVSAVIAVNHFKGKSPEEESGDYVVVTDENGEPVTDEYGQVVTALVSGEEASADESKKTDNKNGNGGSDEKENEATTKQTIKKPDAPKNVTGFKASGETENSITLSWNSVDCDGYQLQIWNDDANGYVNLEGDYKKTSCKVDELEPYTTYYFRIRAFNTNSAGTSASEWSKVTADTKEMKESRKITVYVDLPTDGNIEDTLTIWIGVKNSKGKYEYEEVYQGSVKLDGSRVYYETEDEYKGVVVAWAKLSKEDVESNAKVGGEDCVLNLTSIGIDMFIDDSDF